MKKVSCFVLFLMVLVLLPVMGLALTIKNSATHILSYSWDEEVIFDGGVFGLILENAHFDVTNTSAIRLRNNAVVNLTLVGENTIQVTDNSSDGLDLCGILVDEGCTLTIKEANAGNGRLTITGNEAATAIGTPNNAAGSDAAQITIHSGTVEANGFYTGIGAGYHTAFPVHVTINGGTVKASSGIVAKEITINDGVVEASNPEGYNGSGLQAQGGKVTINGGTVTARGDGLGAGIDCVGGSQVIINGGTVNATGNNGSAGIGGNQMSKNAGTIIINGGTVIARGADGAAGIGGGTNGAGGTVTINGGTVIARGGKGGAGIGGGYLAGGGHVRISTAAKVDAKAGGLYNPTTEMLLAEDIGRGEASLYSPSSSGTLAYFDPPAQAQPSALPRTGDASQPLLWLALSMLSLTGILLFKKRTA